MFAGDLSRWQPLELWTRNGGTLCWLPLNSNVDVQSKRKCPSSDLNFKTLHLANPPTGQVLPQKVGCPPVFVP